MAANDLAMLERSLLAALLHTPQALVEAHRILGGEKAFVDVRHQALYGALTHLMFNGQPINVYTAGELCGIPAAALLSLTGQFTALAPNDLLSLALLIRRRADDRADLQIVAEVRQLFDMPTEDRHGRLLLGAQMLLSRLNESSGYRDPDIAKVSERLDQEIEQYAQGDLIGPSCGLDWFDKRTAGLAPGNVWTIAGVYKGRKCVTGDTLILTRAGWQRIDEVCGDIPLGFTAKRIELWTRQGWSHTSHVYRAPPGPTIKIRTAKGYTLEGTPEHPILIAGEGGRVWCKLGDLRPGMHAAINRRAQPAGTDSLPPPPTIFPARNGHTCRAITFPERMTPDVARFLGYIVAEGTVTNDSKVMFSNTTPEIIGDFLDLCRHLFNVKTKQYGIDYHVNSKRLRMWLAACGVDYVVAADKVVPWTVLQASPECQAAFLNALFSGDGWVSSNGTNARKVCIKTASRTLMRQVQIMLLGFGIVSNLSVAHNKTYDRDYYALHIAGDNAVRFAEAIGFTAQAKMRKLTERVNAQMAAQRRHSSDPIPGMRGVLSQIWAALPKPTDRRMCSLFSRRRAGDARSVEITHRRAERLLAAVAGVVPVEVTAPLQEAIADGYYFDLVVDVQAGCAETWDVTVPGDHSFLSNGFISHNTTLMNNIVLNACLKGASISMFALEGSQSLTNATLRAMLATRKLITWGKANECMLSPVFVMRGRRTPAQKEALEEARQEIDKFALRVYDARDGIFNIDIVRSLIRRDKMLCDLHGFTLDYVQLLGADKGIFERMESASRILQQTAGEEAATAIILTQLHEGAVVAMDTMDTNNIPLSPGVKGGGDLPAASDYLFMTRYKQTAPAELGVFMWLSRFAGSGKVAFEINPYSGLILQQLPSLSN